MQHDVRCVCQERWGFYQARLSGLVLREWIRDELDIGWAQARKDIERTLTLATRKQGITAAVKDGIDVLGMIPAQHPALPEPFLSKRLEPCRKRVREAIAAGAFRSTSSRGGRSG